jgi:NADH:ubiquinone oxidoreductase subunit F (NADH-binding)
MIIKALLDIQERHGYLPQDELEFLALRMNVPLYRVQELTTFFPHFRRQKPPAVTVHICQTLTCHLRGAPGLIKQAEEFGDQVHVEGVSCLGRCDRAPVCLISRHGHNGDHFHDHLYTNLGTRRNLKSLVGEIVAGQTPAPDKDRTDADRPKWEIDLYAPREGTTPPEPYAAVKKFLNEELDGETVIKTLEDADLVGMGGAAARTGKKWRDVRDARGETRYIICNADESEPGTFKDRELLLHTPYLIVEGMLLAGLTLGASHGYIYIRHEYPEQIAACWEAIATARREVPEAMEKCPIEVFTSPGLYICGEESALIEVIEGKRAQPRNQPPDIRNNGLHDQPTLVNNVETYAWVPSILLRQPRDWYKNQPYRFFSLSGDVKKPGVYEVSFRTTIGQLIDLAGGMRDGLQFYAMAPSGPSGGFLPKDLDANWARSVLDAGIPDLAKRSKLQGERVKAFRDTLNNIGDRLPILNLPLDVSLFRTLGLSLGAGMVAYGAPPGQRVPMLEHTRNLLQFFEKESCGKCVPCRLGCQQLVHFTGELLKPGGAGKVEETAETVRTLTNVMEITSICGLGRAASVPFGTWLDYFRDELPRS